MHTTHTHKCGYMYTSIFPLINAITHFLSCLMINQPIMSYI